MRDKPNAFSDGNEQNVILWMDHRASREAEEINKTGHEILQYVGGSISLEMMLPKVLWLKNNHPECFQKAKHFLLIPDFLTWKATGETHRYVNAKHYYECKVEPFYTRLGYSADRCVPSFANAITSIPPLLPAGIKNFSIKLA